MASLLIHIVANSWIAEVANVDDALYFFSGQDLRAQSENVRLFAQAMKRGQGDLLENLRAVLQVGDKSPDQVMNQLLNTTKRLIYEDTTIFAVPADEDRTLLDMIVRAGEDLVEALV
jgi:pyoverdine/dityrosine biosynthesis protein Dit1